MLKKVFSLLFRGVALKTERRPSVSDCPRDSFEGDSVSTCSCGILVCALGGTNNIIRITEAFNYVVRTGELSRERGTWNGQELLEFV